jgi:hypothetical protein
MNFFSVPAVELSAISGFLATVYHTFKESSRPGI